MTPHRPELQGRRFWSGLSILSKRSYATSSFEADDERSDSDDEMSLRDSFDSDVRPGVPAYVGHDVRPTSKKELWGWYMYGFAAETYVICGIASFIPILLETLARENGVLLSNPDKPCGSSDSKSEDDGQCVVYVLGIPVNTASFAMYTFSASVLLQALLVVSISCAADHGNYRKRLLLAFAWIGGFSVMCFIFISKTNYLIGAFLTIISNTSFGASFVLLNSFLPLLVRNHPEVTEAYVTESSEVARLLPPDDRHHRNGLKRVATHEEITSKELQLSTRISSLGIGIGYSAALFVQCASIGILIAMKNTTWSQRVVLFIIGAWWSIFTIPAALWLRPRPGPALTIDGRKDGASWWVYLKYAWKSLFRTIQLARRLIDIMLFLGSWFLLSDAIATTSSTAVLFAKTQLHMKPWALGMINVIATMAGIFGAFGWSWVSRTFNLKPHQTILVCIALFELIPIYGLMGYLPFIKRWGVVGLQQPWEMYPLAAVYGLVMGGLSSYCRSLFGELIPPGSEAAFYALYAITDKGSSVFGPAIVGAIIDKTGSIRPAFWFLGALVGFPAPLIWFIDVERGKREGEKLAETIEGFEPGSPAGEDEEDEEAARGMLADYEAAEGNGNAAHRR
ncbi:vacuole effluxer atg22 like domain-containing protein [Trichoderma breve]|uniref:Autophagy-related protein n=1 Tax=Trichoderma breve TaxID=2034170 RepID=A0A9W9JS99_9HYPO|nr:vacuole effluxer atg22 like domain-containing protein [Trichoderma breve]KAJ4864197.1 vacuole effluxer atg22 like domain-containing protein [Trichoderma breve]